MASVCRWCPLISSSRELGSLPALLSATIAVIKDRTTTTIHVILMVGFMGDIPNVKSMAAATHTL